MSDAPPPHAYQGGLWADEPCAACGRLPDDPIHHLPDPLPHFPSEAYDPELDYGRLTAQMRRLWAVIVDGRWHTLAELEQAADGPQGSLSADLRSLRKPKFGGFVVARKRVTEEGGTWAYRLVLRPDGSAARRADLPAGTDQRSAAGQATIAAAFPPLED